MTTTTIITTTDDRLVLPIAPYRSELLVLSQRLAVSQAQSDDTSDFNFVEYEKDISHLFLTIAQQYTDTSCVHLHTDELVGEAYLKFSAQLSRGYFKVCRTRADFFARLKTIINNHVKGLVQRYRFTIKRTGIKPPPKGKVPLSGEDFRSTKPIEISLDDPEARVQVSEPEAPRDIDDDMAKEIRRTLTALEELVFDQLIAPSPASYQLAEMEAERGRAKSDVVIKVAVKKSHSAESIGLDLDTFLSVERVVKKKVDLYISMDQNPALLQQEAEFSAAMSLLCERFCLQVPRGIERVNIRRLMTLAARRNFDKLDDRIRASLTKVGAKVPASNGLSLNCLGVLFDANNKICSICGHRDQCRVEAATLGLDKIVPHPTVLGVRQMRIPTLITESAPQPPVPNDRNDGILSYVNETFAASVINNDTYYRHRESNKGERPPQIFCIITSRPSECIQLRFCNPSEALKAKLDKRRNGWYLPDTTSVEEAVELIEEHSSQVLSIQPISEET